MTVRSVAILFHERARDDALRGNYRLWTLVSNWERMGIAVTLHFGVRQPITSDVLFPHLDLSLVPDAYRQVLDAHPRVINRRVRDIRKPVYSTQRVQRNDEWPGPVIVKTVANCGGFSDVWLGTRSRLALLLGDCPSLRARALARCTRDVRLQRYCLRYACTLGHYPIYDRLSEVPSAVWKNRNLLVERFIPERHGDSYVMRMWIVFGRAGVGRLLRGSDRYVKNANSALDEFTVPPPEIEAWREKLGLEYGKMDFVMHEGRATLIDVNTTPTVTGDARSEHYRVLNEAMAQEIHHAGSAP